MNRQRRLNKSMDTLFPQSAPDACRVCEEDVVDGRWNYCSTRCREIAQAVQGMFIWDTVREQVLERDDYTCQECGISKAKLKRGYWQTRNRFRELRESRSGRQQLLDKYPVEHPSMPVDHIQRIADGGHPFDESNLQTLCEDCHQAKTAEENRGETNDTRPEIPLQEYMES